MESNKNLILKIAIIILLGISTYTTKVGFELILGNYEPVIREVISIGTAVAISLLLYYFSTLIPKFMGKSSIIGLAFAYIFIALLSILFNFNFFYGRLIMDDSLNEDARRIQNELIEVRTKAELSLKKFYRIDALELEIDSLKSDHKLEVNHPQRPGRYMRAFKIEQDLEKAKNNLANQERKLKPVLENINKTASGAIDILEKALQSQDDDNLVSSIENGIEAYKKIVIEIQTRVEDFNGKQISSDIKRIGKTDFSIKKIVSYFKNEDLKADEQQSIPLAIFLSCLFDIPIFIALIAINLRYYKREDNINPFGEIEDEREEDEIDGNLWT